MVGATSAAIGATTVNSYSQDQCIPKTEGVETTHIHVTLEIEKSFADWLPHSMKWDSWLSQRMELLLMLALAGSERPLDHVVADVES